MTKQESQLWGLERIFALIEVNSDFLAAIKRYKLGRERLSDEEIIAAYRRRSKFHSHLSSERHSRWQQLISPIAEIRASSYAQAPLALHEIFELKQFTWHYLELREYALQSGFDHYDLPDLTELFQLLDPEGNKLPSFRLSPAYSNELSRFDAARRALSQKLKHVRHEILEVARKELGISDLKEEFVLARHEKELILKLNLSPHFVLHRESIANLSYILADNEESNRLKLELAQLNKAIANEEEKILALLCAEIIRHQRRLKIAIDSFKDLAWDHALAEFAEIHRCCIPQISDEIRLTKLRNLPLQLALESENRDYQSLDLCLDGKANLIIGPNMGGKTSILKSLAQCAILIKHAIPLPADDARMPIFDFVFYNHASENDSLSSFGAEVVAFCAALRKPGKGLFLLDEFAKGTNPREGEALATAVIAHLVSSPHRTVATTHFSAPTRLKQAAKYKIKGIDASFAQKAGEDLGANLKALAQAMDYSLINLDESRDPPLDALRIARILGMPEEILKLIPKED